MARPMRWQSRFFDTFCVSSLQPGKFLPCHCLRLRGCRRHGRHPMPMQRVGPSRFQALPRDLDGTENHASLPVFVAVRLASVQKCIGASGFRSSFSALKRATSSTASGCLRLNLAIRNRCELEVDTRRGPMVYSRIVPLSDKALSGRGGRRPPSYVTQSARGMRRLNGSASP